MAAPTLKIRGMKELQGALKGLPVELRGKMQGEIKKSTLAVHRLAVRGAPVDTGRLRSSLRFEVSDEGLTGEIFTDVEYGPHVEFGTQKTRANPFMFNAWNEERGKLLTRLRKLSGLGNG